MAQPTAAVLVTGSELLLGLTADRNSGYLARELDALGIELRRVLTVGDGLEEIAEALRSLHGHDLIVTSGGLGPTHDDRTVEAVALAAGVPLVLDPPTLARIDEVTAAFARQRGLDPATYRDGNRKQASVPEGAEVLPPSGTAPGLLLAWAGVLVVVLPGPPRELAEMWRGLHGRARFADLLARAGEPERHTLRVYGTSESAVANAFAAAGGDADGTLTTICARRLEIEVTIRARPGRRAAVEALAGKLRDALGGAVYAEDERSLEEHVFEALRARGWTVAVAESCTAGLVAARLAEVPGVSEVLLGGVIAYADEVKRDLLGVPAETLAAHGAVSAETAAAMAAGARRAAGADVGVAVTGIAGPGGGSEDKPVGLVHFHVSTPEGERAHRVVFPGARDTVREWAATTALQLVRLGALRHEP